MCQCRFSDSNKGTAQVGAMLGVTGRLRMSGQWAREKPLCSPLSFAVNLRPLLRRKHIFLKKITKRGRRQARECSKIYDPGSASLSAPL